MENDFKFAYLERTNTPLIVGVCGPSSSGKTGSALELAHGFQDILGGDIGMGDSEAGRGNHYQGMKMFSDPKRAFRYKYLEFGAPFSPENYIKLVKAAVAQGIKHLIIDSTSHLHEGPGGILDMHEKEVERLKVAWNVTGDKAQIPAWNKPKRELTEFRNFFTQQKINLIFCFRAKEKLKIKTGDKPKALGFQPIISEELVFEMVANFLLYPGAGGVPTFAPEGDPDEIKAEKAIIKVPRQFAEIFANKSHVALSAWHGQQMATWAKGGQPTQAEPAVKAQAAAAPAPVPAKAAAAPAATAKVFATVSDGKTKGFCSIAIQASKTMKALGDAWGMVNDLKDKLTEAEMGELNTEKNETKARLTAPQPEIGKETVGELL